VTQPGGLNPHSTLHNLPESRHFNLSRTDVVVLILLSSAAAIFVWKGYLDLVPALLHPSAAEYWFESDPAPVFDLMQNRWSPAHERTVRHPLLSVLTFPFVYLMREGLGVTSQTAVGLYLAALGALWIGLIFLTLRLLDLRRLDAILFSVLAGASGAAMFWLPVPESYSLGSISILTAVAAAAFTERLGRGKRLWCFLLVVVCAFTLSTTATNWIAGLILLWLIFDPRQAVLYGLASLGLILLGWGIQSLIFPSSRFFVGSTPRFLNYILTPPAQGALAIGTAFAAHSVVTPAPKEKYDTYLGVQGVSHQAWPGNVAAVAWTLLLVLALGVLNQVYCLWTVQMLISLILAQLALHFIVGWETFVYSLHFGPLLVILTATVALTRLRPLALGLALTVALFGGYNNHTRFREASRLLSDKVERTHRLAIRVSDVTESDAKIVVGQRPEFPGPPGTSRRRPQRPPTADFQPRLLPYGRVGWTLPHEEWFPEVIENLRAKGARYFVTEYVRGLERNRAFAEGMAGRHRLLESTPHWVMYSLDGGQRPARVGSSR